MAQPAHLALLARSLARMRRRRLVAVRAAAAGVVATPWQAAVDRFAARTPVGSALRTAEWADVPVALRERAMFSAGLTSAALAGEMRQRILDGLTQSRPGGTGMDRSRFVAEMRQLLGAAPGDSGQLTELTSFRRLELVYEFQTQSAHAAAAHQASLDPNLLDAFPAQRLVRVESRRVPRDWFSRWALAGEMVGWEGASRTTMVALVTSPIWTALSRFGRPYPPFDFGSGMGVEAVDRDETEQLGLLPREEPPAERLQRLSEASAQARQIWTDQQQASVRDLPERAREWLKEIFGEQIDLSGDTATWVDEPTLVELTPPPTPPPTAPAPTPPPLPLPPPENLQAAVIRATTRAEAHAIVALPENARGTLSIRASRAARPQTEQAQQFLRTLVHKDIAPTASCKVVTGKKITRGWYDPTTATAHVRAGSVPNTVHEVVHHLECSSPKILAACKQYLRSRTPAGAGPQRLSLLTGQSGWRVHELAIEDEWVKRGGSVYSGKVYNGSIDLANATEVLTMGVERLYADPIAFARQDPDYFRFVLSVLRP